MTWEDDHEWCMGREIEGSICVGYFKILAQYLSGGNDRNY